MHFRAPVAEATLRAPPHATTQWVLDCATQRLVQLRKQDAVWDHDITLYDAASGLLETGNFSDDNISGFRLRLQYRQNGGDIELQLKGAGAYFVDLGVEAAMSEFTHGFEACLEQKHSAGSRE